MKKNWIKYLGACLLSILVTYVLAIIESFLVYSSSEAGLPLRFGKYSLFGQAEINYVNLFIDFAFWCLVIWYGWKYLSKFFKEN